MLKSDKSALIVDLETTGLEPSSEEIIEIGLLEFKYSSDSDSCDILTSCSMLHEPSRSISPEITKITGISNELVKGQRINWAVVQQSFDRADVVIAHNVEFDKGFLSNVSELHLENIHWACSCQHINWHAKGFKSTALNYLAADQGFVNPFAHRALFDCATTFKVLSSHFPELYQRSLEREVKVLAVGAPFEKKDLLKSRQYRWNGEQRVWGKVVTESSLDDERAFLSSEIYIGESRHVEEALS